MASHSPLFPSSLEFGSFLVYPSPAVSELEKRAKTLILDLKRNAVTLSGSIISRVVQRLADTAAHSCLSDLLDGTSFLVPMPGSTPLLKNATWSNKVLCDEMVKQGLGQGTAAYLSRTTPIRKSAYCAIHGLARPTPREHYDTLSVRALLGAAPKLLLVDDVITRGSTFIGAAARLREAFPHAEIRAFAVSHTEKDLGVWIVPCHGHITADPLGGWTLRTNDGS